jgi:hypothetical protein
MATTRKPALPDMEALASLQDDLEQKRQEVIEACAALKDVLFAHLAPVKAALGAWREAATEYNEALYDAGVEVDTFCQAHSDRWQDSATGEAYATWGEALTQAQVGTDLDSEFPIRVCLAGDQVRIGDSEYEELEDLVPDAADLPELEV